MRFVARLVGIVVAGALVLSVTVVALVLVPDIAAAQTTTPVLRGPHVCSTAGGNCSDSPYVNSAGVTAYVWGDRFDERFQTTVTVLPDNAGLCVSAYVGGVFMHFRRGSTGNQHQFSEAGGAGRALAVSHGTGVGVDYVGENWLIADNAQVWSWEPVAGLTDYNCTQYPQYLPAEPVAPVMIPLPMAGCGKTMKQQPDGRVSASIAVAAVNPDPDSVDTFFTRTEWETDWVEGASRTVVLPSGGETVTPSGGWSAWCRVTRVVDATAASERPRMAISVPEDFVDCPEGEQWVESGGSCAAPVGGFVAPSIPLLPLPSIMPRVAPPTVMPPPSAVPPVPPSFGTIAGVAGAGIVGWLAGGVLSTALDDSLGMDRDWLCRWNPGYRALNAGLCENLAGGPQTRTAVQLEHPDPATPASLTTWTTAHAYATLRLDPERPLQGTTVITPPLFDPHPLATPEQTAEIISDAGPPDGPEGADSKDCPTGFGLLNPFAFGAILRCMFIPTGLTMASLTMGCADEFPCSWVSEANGAFGIASSGMTSSLGEQCGPTIGFDPPAALSTARFEFRFPTPSSTLCPGNGPDGARSSQDDTAGDLFGYRALARAVATVVLVVAFLNTMVAQLPWSKDDQQVSV